MAAWWKEWGLLVAWTAAIFMVGGGIGAMAADYGWQQRYDQLTEPLAPMTDRCFEQGTDCNQKWSVIEVNTTGATKSTALLVTFDATHHAVAWIDIAQRRVACQNIPLTKR